MTEWPNIQIAYSPKRDCFIATAIVGESWHAHGVREVAALGKTKEHAHRCMGILLGCIRSREKAVYDC